MDNNNEKKGCENTHFISLHFVDGITTENCPPNISRRIITIILLTLAPILPTSIYAYIDIYLKAYLLLPAAAAACTENEYARDDDD